MRRYLIAILFALLYISTPYTYAVPAKPGSGWVGDEYFHYREGEPPKVMPTKEELAALRRLPEAKHASYPTTGEPLGLVILVNFSDVKFVTENPQQAFSSMLNESGYSENYGTGSARDYYIACSDSAFRPRFDVYGPFTLPNKMEYYGAPKGSAHDSHAAQMIEEACVWAESAGIDLAKYDTNNDGVIDNVFVYYAGYNQAEGGPEASIWPHRSRVTNAKTVCGKEISDYACTSELSGARGKTMCGIGTFCHEFSHVLGLPDMYNTEDGSKYTVGAWDIMAGGNYNNNGHTPPTYTAFERFMMGWFTPEQLSNPSDYELSSLESNGGAYLIAEKTHNMDRTSPDPEEFWMIENRQHVGWDTHPYALPGVGLLITHISYNAGTWKSNKYNNSIPLGFDVCEAYLENPSKASASDTYPGSMNITTFTPTNNAGEALREHMISAIHYIDSTEIVFHYGEVYGTGFSFNPQSCPTILTEYRARQLDYHIEPMLITGTSLQGDSVFISFSNNAFQISPDGETWLKEFADTIASDSTYYHQFYLRHIPARQCSSGTGVLHVRANNYMHHTQLILNGKSSRAILIEPVVTQPAEDITPYSFVATWKEQEDAEYYYLSLYRLIEGNTSIDYTEELQPFKKDSDYTETSILPISPTELEITLSHTFLGGDESGAQVIILAQTHTDNAEQWLPIDTVTMRAISQNYNHTYSFAESEQISRFRFVYKHLAGEGTIQIRLCKALLPRKIETIYEGEEHEIPAPAHQAQISDLAPENEYSYQLVAYENKGCEPHTTALGYSTRVKTLQGAEDTKKHLTVYITENKSVIVYFPVVTKAGKELLLYDIEGHLLKTYPVPENEFMVEIASPELQINKVYLLKYGTKDGTSDSISRKDRWAKFLYK